MPSRVRPMPMAGKDFDDAERAVAHLALPRDAVISLKLRPVQWNDEHTELWDAYVYPAEYAQAQMTLKGRRLTDIGMGDRATLLSDGEQVAMLIEHETGPEVILLAKLAVAAASVSLLKEVFSFLKELLKAINEASEKRKKAKEPIPERYYAADAVTLELRLKGDPKLLSGLELPVIDEKTFEQFLKEGIERAGKGEEWPGFSTPHRPQ